MLMYGTTSNIPDIENVRVYNLTGYNMSYNNLNYLVPNPSFGIVDSREFDQNYYNFIIGNDQAFIQFFQIIQQLYTGKHVYIVSGNEDWCENLIESLLKIIQQRYGYNAVYITCEEDFMEMYTRDDSSFSRIGIQNLDQDKERYSYLVNSLQLQNPDNNIKVQYE